MIEKQKRFRKWLDRETTYSTEEKNAMADGYGYGISDGYEMCTEDIRNLRKQNADLTVEKSMLEKENAELKAKLLFNYENIARLTNRSVEEVEKAANEIFLKRINKI